jgi:hypothetical protein
MSALDYPYSRIIGGSGARQSGGSILALVDGDDNFQVVDRLGLCAGNGVLNDVGTLPGGDKHGDQGSHSLARTSISASLSAAVALT